MITRTNTIRLGEKSKQDIITTQEIYETGLKKHDIPQLIEDNLIKRIKRGKYIATKEFLEEYSDLLLSYDLKLESIEYLEKLYQKDLNNRELILKLFLANIKEGSLLDIVKYYRELKRVSVTKNEIADTNLYLRLMSLYLPLPKDLKETANRIHSKKVKISNVENCEEQNEFRKKLLQQKFSNINILEYQTIHDEIINSLISGYQKNHLQIYSVIIEAIEQEKFTEIIKLLGRIHNIRNLTTTEYQILTLTEKIKNLKRSKNVKVLNLKSRKFEDYIYANRFEEAKNLFKLKPILKILLNKLIIITKEKTQDADSKIIIENLLNENEGILLSLSENQKTNMEETEQKILTKKIH